MIISLRSLARVFLAIATAVAIAALRFESNGDYQEFFAENPSATTWAIWVLVAAAVAEPVRAALLDSYRRWRETSVMAAYAALIQALLDIDEVNVREKDRTPTKDKVPWNQIVLHAWEVPPLWQGWRSWCWEWQGLRAWPIRHRLVRLVSVRHDAKQASGVDWVRRRGVLGMSWHLKTELSLNSSKELGKYGERAAWEKSQVAKDWNLDWEDWRKLRGYGAVFVFPITDRKKRVRGLVTLDGPPGSFTKLNKPRVQEAVIKASGAIRVAMTRERDGS